MNKEELHFCCRVCWYKNSTKPWWDDNKTPTFDICPCCWVEFWYEDNNFISVILYRNKWINAGCIWFDINLKPNNWDFNIQKLNISDNFK